MQEEQEMHEKDISYEEPEEDEGPMHQGKEVN